MQTLIKQTSLKKLSEINNRYKNLQNEYQEGEEFKPKLENYYKPSQEMKEYQNVFFLIVGLSGGYLGYKFLQ